MRIICLYVQMQLQWPFLVFRLFYPPAIQWKEAPLEAWWFRTLNDANKKDVQSKFKLRIDKNMTFRSAEPFQFLKVSYFFPKLSWK